MRGDFEVEMWGTVRRIIARVRGNICPRTVPLPSAPPTSNFRPYYRPTGQNYSIRLTFEAAFEIGMRVYSTYKSDAFEAVLATLFKLLKRTPTCEQPGTTNSESRLSASIHQFLI